MKNSQKLILTVDDSAVVRASLQSALAANGFGVVQARDGLEGLGLLNGLQPDEDHLVLIISDVNMPHMDGLAFIAEVKKSPWKFVPVLFLTTETDDVRKMEGKRAGAAGWIVKPYNTETLLRIVRKFVPF